MELKIPLSSMFFISLVFGRHLVPYSHLSFYFSILGLMKLTIALLFSEREIDGKIVDSRQRHRTQGEWQQWQTGDAGDGQ